MTQKGCRRGNAKPSLANFGANDLAFTFSLESQLPRSTTRRVRFHETPNSQLSAFGSPEDILMVQHLRTAFLELRKLILCQTTDAIYKVPIGRHSR